MNVIIEVCFVALIDDRDDFSREKQVILIKWNNAYAR